MFCSYNNIYLFILILYYTSLRKGVKKFLAESILSDIIIIINEAKIYCCLTVRSYTVIRRGLNNILFGKGTNIIMGKTKIELLPYKQQLEEIYYILYNNAGYQKWWPADSPFEVAVGAILAQFVSWENAAAAIDNLKKNNALSIEKICGIDDSILEEYVKPARFYKQKAKKLKNFCCYVMNNYNCSLTDFFNKDILSLRQELLSLYGIGEETADSIILYAAEKPIFVIDAYTKRIFHRLGFLEENISYKNAQQFFMENLESNIDLFNDYHAQIVMLGKNYCFNKKPKCKKCPLLKLCEFADNKVS